MGGMGGNMGGGGNFRGGMNRGRGNFGGGMGMGGGQGMMGAGRGYNAGGGAYYGTLYSSHGFIPCLTSHQDHEPATNSFVSYGPPAIHPH